jgi:hypothetical protein
MAINVKYIGKYEVKCEPAFGYELGEPCGFCFLKKKNRGQEPREKIPLTIGSIDFLMYQFNLIILLKY